MAGSVQIHQALHGYQRGHRLLESSTTLPDSVARLMLVLSDLSGSGLVPGFETYLTGYPLESAAYAFARTWYAPEMPRPGCVWTHTLIIREKDLALIPDLRFLCQLFHRPASPGERNYGSTIPLSLSNAEASPEQQSTQSAADSALIEAYYGGSADQPVLVPARYAVDYEHAIMGLWTQQWPELRRAFSFCTGSLANRSLGSRAFDIQAVPALNLRQVQRQALSAVTISLSTGLKSHKEPEWVRTAARELSQPLPRGLQSFLQRHAEYLEGPARRKFAPLATCFHAVQRRDGTADELVETLARLFPWSWQGVELKRGLLGDDLEREAWRHSPLREWDLVSALALTTQQKAFLAETLHLSRRARSLWTLGSRQMTETLLLQTSKRLSQPLAQAIFVGLMDGVSAGEFQRLVQLEPDFVLSAVDVLPRLACSPSVWQTTAQTQTMLVRKVFARAEIEDETLAAIVRAMLSAGSDLPVQELSDQHSARLVRLALRWSVDHYPIQTLLPGWVELVARHAKEVLAWLRSFEKEIPVGFLAFLARTLDPRNPQVRAAGADVWLRHLSKGAGHRQTDFSNSQEIGGDLLVFLFALGISDAGTRSDELVSLVFEPLHRTVAQAKLTKSQQDLLQEILPDLAFSNWDWCERLRRGLIMAFVSKQWPRSALLRTVRSEDVRKAVIKSCNRVEGGKTILQILAVELRGKRSSKIARHVRSRIGFG